MTRLQTPHDRTVLAVTGADRVPFLQGLLTNDVADLGAAPRYAALLTPQGKLVADLFVALRRDAILLDVAAAMAPALLQRLTMYRLRADASVAAADIPVAYGLGPAPRGAHPDPRAPGFGWRAYGDAAARPDPAAWDAARVDAMIPESTVELISGESYILEMHFPRLSGVDFRKGCYVGQEVTARMHHKTELKKGLARVTIEGSAPPGTPIETEDGRPAGTLFTSAAGRALAHLRFDRAHGPMKAGDVSVSLETAGVALTP